MSLRQIRTIGLIITAAVLVGIAAWCARLQLARTAGDASIYWTFAQSMWEHGVFYYGHEGPKHGATSPLWALILGLFQPLARDHWIGYKLIGLAALAGAAGAGYRLGWTVTGNRVTAAIAGIGVLYLSRLQEAAAVGYETPLFVALLLESLRATLMCMRTKNDDLKSSDVLRWAVPVSLMPLARPEGIVFLALFSAVVGWGNRNLFRRRLRTGMLGLIVIAPTACYHFAMWGATGSLVPSSIEGRYIRAAREQLPTMAWESIADTCVGVTSLFLGPSNIFPILWYVMIVVGLLTLWRRNHAAALLLGLVPAIMFALLVWRNPGLLVLRYGVPVAAVCMLLATIGVAGIREWLERRVTDRAPTVRWAARGAFLTFAVVLAAQPVRHLWRISHRVPRIPVDTVLDREASLWLNENVLKPDDRVLVYEIQTQAYIRAQVISADGIVGGEILPHLRDGDLCSFFREHRITHVLSSDVFLDRSIFHGTVLERLAKENTDWLRDESRELCHGLVFKKLGSVGREKNPLVTHWDTIFTVDAESVPPAHR